jgi:hypothetical protein
MGGDRGEGADGLIPYLSYQGGVGGHVVLEFKAVVNSEPQSMALKSGRIKANAL